MQSNFSFYKPFVSNSIFHSNLIIPSFYLYAPEGISRGFDGSLVIILFMAVFTLTMGSFWSGEIKEYL